MDLCKRKRKYVPVSLRDATQNYTSRTCSVPRVKTRMSLVQACSVWRARSRQVTLLHNSSRISAERQKRRCPTETRANTAAMAAAADTTKPKTSPKSIKFLFGGLAGYVCTHACSGALCYMGLNWMSDWWEIIDECYHPLSAARAIDQDQYKDFMWCVMSFLGSFCEFCCECICRPRESLVTPCQSELQFKCHASSCVTEECTL